MRELIGRLVAIGGVERVAAHTVAGMTGQHLIGEALHRPWMNGHARETMADEVAGEIAAAIPGFGRFI